MSLLWEIIKTIGVMLVVIIFALTPSSHDNLHVKRLERQRRRWMKTNKKNSNKFFKELK